MSSALYALGRWCYRMRRRVVLAWVAILVIIGATAGITMGVLGGRFSDEFKIPGAQSEVALEQLRMTFDEVSGTRASLLVIAPPGHTVDEPLIKNGIERGAEDFKKLDYVKSATSPFDPMIKGMVNDDRSAAILNVMLKPDQTSVTDAQRDELQKLTKELTPTMPEGTQLVMGGDAYGIEIPGVTVVELFGLIVAGIVLFVTFGSILAGLLPVATALWGVAIALSVMVASTKISTITSTTPMLALMLGVAVGIDYALFILSRHRDQLQHGLECEESTARSVATAGSAVVFAGLTVIIALIGLAVANIPFLTIMGIFAALAVAVAVAIALTLLPALMGYAGERLRPKKAIKPGQELTDEHHALRAKHAKGGAAGWWVRVVTKVPLLTVLIVVVSLGVVSVPAKDLQLSLPNSGQHLAHKPERINYDLVDEKFGPGFNGPLVATFEIIQSTDPLGLVDNIKKDIEAIPGVHSVPLATPNRNADTAFIQIVPETGPTDPATQKLVDAIRAKAPYWKAKYDVDVSMTGMTAVQIDISAMLGRALLPFGIFVVGLSLILLTIVFRSIWVPIKATVGYLLSVGSAFGAATLVFNQGWFKQVVNLEKPMPIISFLPILLMGILFGLAMDYEVFLVSRMREEYVHGKSAQDAIIHGFIGSSKVVVAAALIMVSVFAFFVPEGQGPIKAIAFGLAVGVAIDAFVVRMTLVPAVLALLGDKAWWLPKWLDERLPYFDVEGESLARMLALQDWPAPDSNHVLVTEDFAVAPREGLTVNPVDLHLDPGEVLVVEGDPVQRTPLLLALSGHLKQVTGKAKIGDLVLPEQAGNVRRSVAYVDVLNSTGSTTEALMEAAGDDRVQLLIVDGADALPGSTERATLTNLIEHLPWSNRRFAVVLGAADSELVAGLAPNGFHRIELIPPQESPRRELVTPDGHPAEREVL